MVMYQNLCNILQLSHNRVRKATREFVGLNLHQLGRERA
jgi:hypothetical protein